MPAMTPIKEILVVGSTVFYIDHSGRMNYGASAVSDEEALVIAAALATYHKMPDAIRRLNVLDRLTEKVDLDDAARGRRK